MVSARNLPRELSQPGGGANLRSLDPEDLCDKIFQGIANGTQEIILPQRARWLAAINSIFPSLGDYLIRKNMGKSRD